MGVRPRPSRQRTACGCGLGRRFARVGDHDAIANVRRGLCRDVRARRLRRRLVSIVGGWAFRDLTTGLPDVPDDLGAPLQRRRHGPFAPDSGFVVENSAVQWTQVDHSVHPLAPAVAATSTLTGGPVAFTTNPANVVGELVTN
jgi:hypothetical protein